MRTEHPNRDRVARAPRAPRPKAPAVDAGARVGDAGVRSVETPGMRELLQLQRSVGNAAVARMLEPRPAEPSQGPELGRERRSLTSSARPFLQRFKVSERRSGKALVQRVGGQKIGFDLTAPTDATIKAGQDLLVAQWRQIRQTEHDLKVGTERTDVEAGAQELIAHRARQKERDAYRTTNPTATKTVVDTAFPVKPAGRTGGGFSKYYYDKLTGRSRTRQLPLLQTGSAFGDARLIIDVATGAIQYRPDPTQAYVTIGTLKKGSDAFKVKTPTTPSSGTQRDVLEKHGVSTDLSNEAKEYVKDTRGVVTRRYAYVEKNYWQMMEFFMTGRHEGRFQSFMKAAGEPNPSLFEARQPEVDIVRGAPTASTTGTLTKKQLAVAHQKLGSGPQQRGVSLTSTPKVGATYVNTGENFRTDRGFRLKIDLALIPPPPAGPLLINHYSHGGVIDKPTKYDTTRERGKASKYPYLESALHARELYLEYLKPEWVVAIESHPTVTGASTTIDLSSPLGHATSLFQLGKSQFGGTSFQQGFDEGLGNGPNSLPGDQNHTDGFNHAKSFGRGWDDGHAEHTRVGAGDAGAAATAHITVAQYVYDKSMAVDLPTGEYDIYRMGYLQGRSGVAKITAGANLPH